MHKFTTDDINVEELRQRLRKMTDRELPRFGEAARFMCSKRANGMNPPRQAYIVQLE